MFQQIDEEALSELRHFWQPQGCELGEALEELHLYRDLGTLQQLSYATEISKQLNEIGSGINRLLFIHDGRFTAYSPIPRKP
jgi:hypothetical protein